MSKRVMETLKCFFPHVEVYSIDEAFLDFTGFSNQSLTVYGKGYIETFNDGWDELLLLHVPGRPCTRRKLAQST